MLKKILAVFTSSDPLVNWGKAVVLLIVMALAVIFMSNVSTSKDLLWFQTGFEVLPNRIIVYHNGEQTELLPGQPGFDELAEAIRASLAQGVANQSSTGLSEVSRQEAYTRHLTIEAFFAEPVKLHAWFYTGYPTQMLFPITGRHSDWPIVFLGKDGEYQSNAPVLKTKEPIIQMLKASGYFK